MSSAMSTRWGALVPDEDFPQRLRALRLRRGWTQKELARIAGLKENGFRTIQDWERGSSSPRVGGKINLVASVLGVPLAWLLWGEEEDDAT